MKLQSAVDRLERDEPVAPPPEPAVFRRLSDEQALAITAAIRSFAGFEDRGESSSGGHRNSPIRPQLRHAPECRLEAQGPEPRPRDVTTPFGVITRRLIPRTFPNRSRPC